MWSAAAGHARVAAIVEESHFSVRVVACAACGQRFASVFAERIDWRGGDDPQDWLLVPVSADEAQALIAAGESGVERALAALAPERHLVRSFPRDAGAPSAAWRTGPLFVPFHD